MKTLFPLILAALFFTLAPVPSAQASLLEFLFPSLRQAEPDPAVTLEAPFARDPAERDQPYIPGTQVEAKPQPLPENMIPLERPHRNTSQIADWVGPMAAEAMTFTHADPNVDMEAVRPHFSENGYALYQKFLQTHKVQNVLDLNKYAIRTYVKDAPLLLNEANVQGHYNWLFEVPVMVSYLNHAQTTYEGADPVNQQFVLRVQVGRSNATDDPMGIVITNWDGKSVNMDKK